MSQGSEGNCFYKAMKRIFFQNIVQDTPYSNPRNTQFNFLISLLRVDFETYSEHLDNLEEKLNLLETEENRSLFSNRAQNYQQLNKENAKILRSIHQTFENEETQAKLNSMNCTEDSFKRIFPLEKLELFISSNEATFLKFLSNNYWTDKKNLYVNFLLNTCNQDSIATILNKINDDEVEAVVSQLQNIVQALSALQSMDLKHLHGKK